jgi:magnesium transporter
MDRKSLISPEIKEILKSPSKVQHLKSAFEDVHPYDIFILCEDLENEEVAECVKALGIPVGIDLFEEFEDERKKEIFNFFNKEWMADVLEEMAPDDRADFVKHLSEERTEEVLPLVARAERLDIKKLIEYKEGTAGSILTTEYASLPEDVTVKQAIDKIKLQAFDSETIYYIYVIDQTRKLLGFVSLRDLIISPSNQKIKDIMNKNVIYANVNEDSEEVAKKLSDYDFLAIPIIDDNECLIGIVTIDDVVDVVIEESTEDILKLAAAGEYVDYMKASFLSIAKQRFLWLLILVFVGFISAWVLEKNSVQLESVVALTFFIPLLLGAGGNAGTQSSTVVIRGMAMGDIEMKDVGQVFLKELFVGVIVGGLMAALVSIRALILEKDPKLGITVGCAMVATVMLATTLGALLPMLFKRMKLDPALMSGPFITSIVDIVSLLIYFKVALMVF